ncbi:MAG: hypothetical protein UV28_C0008G0009 [Candidatus Collierbacteria bacterium GW2011_GWE2_42_48]|nr:MAG: hypothetical protein UV28_C0008G0009 [Candidatus Collierbacteria bacterium GW2011_GWE2_42_48]
MGISKLFSFITPDNVSYQLTEKEKRFCEVYCQSGVSGIDAIFEAGYLPKKRSTAYSIASENLRKPKILAYIKHLYSEHSFTDEDIMREHLYLIRQHHDLSAKARGIDMYYKKNGYYSAGSIEKNSTTTVVVTQYSEMSDEQLEERYRALKRKLLE